MARSMLKTKGLRNGYWYYAVEIMIYILNKYSTRSLHDMNPHEAWYGTKPTIDHLRVFGYLAFAHVNAEVRKKLDDKSVACIYIFLFIMKLARHIDWYYTVETTMCILNRCSTKALHNMTPHEAWYGIKPTIGHLRVFGYLDFVPMND